jgi:hypothetical protein
MLLIIFLGLIAKLTLVYGDNGNGTGEMNDFDWSKVGIKTFMSVLNFICCYTNKLSIQHIRLYVRVIE